MYNVPNYIDIKAYKKTTDVFLVINFIKTLANYI